jgi:hypothetical protein
MLLLMWGIAQLFQRQKACVVRDFEKYWDFNTRQEERKFTEILRSETCLSAIDHAAGCACFTLRM